MCHSGNIVLVGWCDDTYFVANVYVTFYVKK